MVTTSTAGRIVVRNLTKTYGAVRAVDDVSFTVEPGTVTGFLGRNGAGKTTTLRMLLGLVAPDAGSATVGGRRYADLPAPGHEVGAVLDSTGFHPARTGRAHLRVCCTVGGYPYRRADEVLDLVGLSDAGRRAVRGYSLGMRQRLALAAALLGEPGVLVLDEPANGLDPDGIAWLRWLLREFAAQGRTVLVSSHLLAETQQLVDDVVVLDGGRLAGSGPLAELVGRHSTEVLVRSPQPEQLRAAVDRAGGRAELAGPDNLLVTGLAARDVGEVAFAAGVRLHGLAPLHGDLEQVFFSLVAGERENPSRHGRPAGAEVA